MNYKIVLGRKSPPYSAELPEAAWTSTYFSKGPDFTAALADGQALNTAEMGLCPPVVEALWVKAFELGNPRVFQTVPPTQKVGTWTGAGSVANCDPDLSCLYRLAATSGKVSNKYFRGLPNEFVVIAKNLIFRPDSTYGSNKQLYTDAVKGHAVLMNRGNNPPAGWAPVPITNVYGGYINADNKISIRRAGRPFVLRHGRRIRA